LIVYDTIICFPSECSLIWNRPFGLVAVSYLAARYGFLCFIALYIGCLTVPFVVGRVLNIAACIFVGVAMLGTQTLIFLRTTAISGRNFVLNGILFLIGIGSWMLYIISVVTTNFGDVFRTVILGSPFDGYFSACSICGESLIIAATVYYTRHYFIARRHSDTMCKGSLTRLLVKQGILRYSIILFWSILIISAQFGIFDDGSQIMPYRTLIVSSTPMSVWCVSLLATCGLLSASHDYSMAVILICRMILELRKFSRRPNNTSSARLDNRQTSIILRFAHRMHQDIVDEFVDSLMDLDDEIEGLSLSATGRSLEDGNAVDN